MPGYRASRPSLFGHVGAPRDTRGPGVDYGQILDSISNGASSLIRNAYLIRQQKAQLQREDDDRAYTRSRDEQQDRFEREKFDHERTMDRATLLERGYHEDAHEEPTEFSAPTGEMGEMRPGSITAAMQGKPPSMAPPPTAPLMRTTQAAEPHFDVDRSVSYRTATDRARITGELANERATATATERARLQSERLVQQRANIEFLARSRADIAKWRQQNPAHGGAVGRAMTGNQLNTFNIGIARGMLELNGGNVNQVVEDFRATPAEGRPEGMTEDHIVAAYGQLTKGAVGQTLGLVRGLDMGVAEAGAKRDSVVRALTPPRGAAAVRAPAPHSRAAPDSGGRRTHTPRAPNGAQAPAVRAPAARADTAASKTRVPDPGARARALVGEGKSREDILRIMKAEGYNVIDSGQRK